MASAKFYGTGRRKKSIARVYLTPGTGKITINKRDIDEYFGLETLKVIVVSHWLQQKQKENLTFSLTLKVADTQDRLVPSDMVLQEPFLKQMLNTDQFLKLLDSLHVIHV